MVTEKQALQFVEAAKVAASANMERALDLKEKIVSLNFEAIHKIAAILKGAAGNNGICGLGCSASDVVKFDE